MPEKPRKKMGEKVSLGYAWYALGVLFAINLINYVDRLSIGPAVEHLKRDFSITDAQIGMIMGSFMLVYAVLSLPMGYISDKGARTKIIALGALVWSIATTISGFCRGFTSFFIARGAVGAGEGIYAPSGTALVADYFPKRLRNTSIAIFMSAMILGGAIAYIVAGLILKGTDKYDIPQTEALLIDEGMKSLAGWEYSGIENARKCRVKYTFHDSEGNEFAAYLGKVSEEKKDKKKKPSDPVIDFRSKLFDVDYMFKGEDDAAKFSAVAAEFVQFLNTRIQEREGVTKVNGTDLQRIEVPLMAMPHGFEKVEEIAKHKDGRIEYKLIYTGEGEKNKIGLLKKFLNWIESLIVKDDGTGDQIEFKKELMAKYSDRLSYTEKQRPVMEPTALQKTGIALKKLMGHGGHDDGIDRTLVFKGIVTKAEKQELQLMSDSDNYQKALGELFSSSKYHFLKSDNWKWIFLILGPPGLLFALLAFFLKEPLKGGSEDFLSEDEAKRVEEKAQSDYSVIYKTPSLVLMIFSNILATFCVGGLNAWLFPFVERYKGVESADAAIIFGPWVVGAAVLGVIISGMLADKLQKITPRGNNIIVVAGIALGIPPMYVFLHTPAENTVQIVAAISLCLFFLVWINGPMNALLMSLVEPRLRAVVNGLHILLIHVFGDAISPFIIGYQSDVNGLAYALAILPIILAASAVGFGIASIFVPKDLMAVEKRMKDLAAAGVNLDLDKPVGH